MLLFARNAHPLNTLHLFLPIIQVPEVFEARQAIFRVLGLRLQQGSCF